MATNKTATASTAWQISESLGTISTANASKKITIPTSGTYLDRNIEVTVSATAPAAATLGASATGSATVPVGVGTKADGKYPFTGTASITGTANASTTTSGYATAGTTKASGSTTGTAGVSGSMNAIGLGASATGSASITSISVGTYDSTNNRYPITGSATISGTATATVTSTGYGTKDVETGSGSTSGTASLSAYMTRAGIGVVTAANKPASGYTENTTAVVPTGGYLKIDAGYMPNTIISLATLVPNSATITNNATGAATMRTGTSAYDKDGNLITGTMGNATVSNGAVTHNLAAPEYDSTDGVFKQVCTIAVAAPVVTSGKGGYIDESTGTKNATAETSESHNLAKIAGTYNATATAAIKANSTSGGGLSAGAVASGEGWTDAKSGAGVTSVPTSGVYVKVSRSAFSSTVTATATPSFGITTSGYGTSANNGFSTSGATTKDQAVTLSAGSIWVPITSATAGTHTKPTASATGNVSLGTVTTTKPSSGYYIQVDATTGKYKIATAGWITAGDKETGAATTRYYPVSTASLTHGNTATETVATATVKSTASTVTASSGANTTTGTTDNTYYITVGKDGVTAGSVVHSASVSEGYVPSGGLSQNATIATSANVTAKTFYFASTAVNADSSVTLAGTSTATTGYNTPSTVSANTAIPQLDLSGSLSGGTVGYVLKSKGSASHKYINYFTGSYTVE